MTDLYGGGGGGLYSSSSGSHSGTVISSGHKKSKHWWDRLGANIIHAGEDFGTGMVYGTAALGKASLHALEGHPGELAQLGKQSALSVVEDFQHPLRHPLNTILDVASVASGGVGLGLRTAEALRVAGALRTGAEVGDVGSVGEALLRSPSKHIREIKVPSPEGVTPVRGRYRKGSLSHLAGMKTDRALERGAARSVAAGRAPSGRFDPANLDVHLENRLHKRVEKWNRKAAKIEQDKLRFKGLKVVALAKKYKLDPGQQRALRIVAETAPYDEVKSAANDRFGEALTLRAEANHEYDTAKTLNERRAAKRKQRAANAAVAGHQDRIEWINDAKQYIDEQPDANGVMRPQLKADQEGLQHVFTAMQDAVGEREAIIHGLGIMDAETFAGVHDKVAKIAAGGHFIHDSDARKAADDAAAHGLAAEHQLRRDMQANVREAAGASREADKNLGSAESRLFREQTARSQAEKDARRQVDAAQRELTRQTTRRARVLSTKGQEPSLAHRAAQALDAKRLLDREQEIARIMWERYQRGEVGSRAIERNQRRLARLQAVYDRNAPHLAKLREQEGVVAETTKGAEKAAAEMEQHAAALREAEKASGYRVNELEQELRNARREARNAAREHDLTKQLREAKLLQAKQATEAAFAEQLAKAHTVVGSNVTAGPGVIHIGDERTPGLGIRGESKRTERAIRASSTGTFGRTRSTSTRELTGRNRELGLESNLTTDLVAKRHAEAARLARLATMVKRLAPMGSKIPRRQDDIFLWTDDLLGSGRIDPSVKDFLLDPESYTTLSEEDARTFPQRLRSALMGTDESGNFINWDRSPAKKQELEAAAAEGKGVFVPRRLIGDAAHRATIGHEPATKLIDAVNNVEKSLLIYAKPSYPLIQGLSNVAMNMVQQGIFAPRNLAWAIGLSREGGRETASLVDTVMGGGFVHHAGFAGQGKIASGSRKMADVMGKTSDVAPRRAAWYHEARKAGYSTAEDIRALLSDEAHHEDLIDVTQRAKDAIVDFDNLSQREKAHLRRYIFVYPWVKGSTVYLSHFLQDHPAQAAVYANLGEYGANVNQREFGDRPTYAENWIPTPWGRVDLQSLNPFTTPLELGRTVASIASGSPKGQAGASYLSPGPAALLALLSRRDELGMPLSGNLIQNLRQLLIAGAPLSRAATGLAGDREGAAYDALRVLLGTPRESKTYPDSERLAGAYDPLAIFGAGGLFPRGYSRSGLASAASRQGQR